jgi:hypothetical protein
MGITILFFSGLAVIAVWWLSTQRLTSKPWLEQGAAGEFPGTGVSSAPMAKVGLGVFLAAIGSLFALFISAYFMRMQLADWRPVPKPTLLWVNTGVLMLPFNGHVHGRIGMTSPASGRLCLWQAERHSSLSPDSSLLGGSSATRATS